MLVPVTSARRFLALCGLFAFLTLFRTIQIESPSLEPYLAELHSATEPWFTADQEPHNDTTIKARVFLPWKNATTHPLPCIIDQFPDNSNLGPFHETVQRQPSQEGLLFVKIDKAGSSTVSGVAARIAHSLAKTTNKTGICRARISHVWSKRHKAKHGGLHVRNKTTSFLWTILRDPAKRAASSFFFFAVGRTGANTSDASAIQHFESKPNFELAYVQNHPADQLATMNTARLSSIAQTALGEFNFIGTLERLDESLVLLQLILDLEPSDVLYMNAKHNAEYDSHTCNKLAKRVSTPAIEEYLSSEQWMRDNEGDYMFYDAVNRSIDLTIDFIGRTKFDRALTRFRQVKAIADRECEYMDPCIDEGVLRPEGENGTRCYWQDSGCGYECLDRLFQNTTV